MMTVAKFQSETDLWLVYQDAYNKWCANPIDETTREKDRRFASWQRAFLLCAHVNPVEALRTDLPPMRP